jgi:phosphohistidine phosphatase
VPDAIDGRCAVDSAPLYRDSEPVQVFLIRHADAIDETHQIRDPYRYLTDKGREQARALGDRLRWHDCTPTEVWMSPLVRAVQTAELVLSSLGGGRCVVTEPALAPTADVRLVAQRLRKLAAGSVVMVVGHEPILSGLGTLLIGSQNFAALARAEAVRVDAGTFADHGGGELARVRWRFAWNDSAPRL